MKQIKYLQDSLISLRLVETSKKLPSLLEEAEKEQLSYIAFLNNVVEYERKMRDEKNIEKRLKLAEFPCITPLEQFNLDEQESLSLKQFNQLKELAWIEQLFNLILLGPPGVGKTHMAVGLGLEAIKRGYRVSFIAMGDLVHTLKTMDITRKSQTRIKRIKESQLVIIDDLMYAAMDPREANLFFQLVNDLYNNSSIILTSNRSPKEWTELLGDVGVATAILDRLIHRAEIVHFNDSSYRMKHRETIFKEESVQN
ncbi:IS21-like element helper ATPase IstB [Neobacillus sp. C211]|uniref:IS21-like element helper ATPase IstB n=1 Tax=unclassified Neobacillus TaxID=2675272 RepID=UPI00397AE19A